MDDFAEIEALRRELIQAGILGTHLEIAHQ